MTYLSKESRDLIKLNETIRYADISITHSLIEETKSTEVIERIGVLTDGTPYLKETLVFVKG